MTKQHVIDHYGPVNWTIGTGCSGGSLVQQQVANAYPGIYQGITPQCSFTDAWSSAHGVRRLLDPAEVLRGPDRLGCRDGLDADRDPAGARPPERRQPGDVHQRRSRTAPTRRAPARTCPRRRSTSRGPTRTASSARCSSTWSTSSGCARTASPTGRSATTASSTACRAAERRDVTRPTSSTSTQGRRADQYDDLPEGAQHARPDRAEAGLSQRRGRLGEQPQPGGDHRPSRSRPRRVPRRLPDLRDARPAAAQLRYRGQPGAVARPRSAGR